jgi:FkbM family methyltransferase
VAANTKPHTRRWFRPRPGDVVVDAGAHIGRFSLAAARAGASVVAVEPNPETFRVLAANVKLNGFRNVRLVNAALGEREGEAELHVPLVHHGTASLRGDWERRFATRTVRVRVTTLDGLVEELGLERVDWLLVDVEGYELEVLRGGLGVARARRPEARVARIIRTCTIPLILRALSSGEGARFP